MTDPLPREVLTRITSHFAKIEPFEQYTRRNGGLIVPKREIVNWSLWSREARFSVLPVIFQHYRLRVTSVNLSELTRLPLVTGEVRFLLIHDSGRMFCPALRNDQLLNWTLKAGLVMSQLIALLRDCEKVTEVKILAKNDGCAHHWAQLPDVLATRSLEHLRSLRKVTFNVQESAHFNSGSIKALLDALPSVQELVLTVSSYAEMVMHELGAIECPTLATLVLSGQAQSLVCGCNEPLLAGFRSKTLSTLQKLTVTSPSPFVSKHGKLLPCLALKELVISYELAKSGDVVRPADWIDQLGLVAPALRTLELKMTQFQRTSHLPTYSPTCSCACPHL